jgi:hypothetical protein
LDGYVQTLDVERFEEDLRSLLSVLWRVKRWFGLNPINMFIRKFAHIISNIVEDSQEENNGLQAQHADI